MNFHRIILLGPPAAGKGTQGRLMMERWGASVASTGDVLRTEIADGSEIGQEAAQYMDHGRLVPDRVALAGTERWLNAHEDAFVFDGFPRTVGQAEALQELLNRRGIALTTVLWLEISFDMIQERISRRVVCTSCGRSFQLGNHLTSRDEPCPVCGARLSVRHDDEPAKLANRMEQYQLHTEPVMHHYERRGLLSRIVADGTPEQVFTRIEDAVATARTEALI